MPADGSGTAAAATADLRARLARGEAHRQGLALCRGGPEGPEATIELSNHGAYAGSSQSIPLPQRSRRYALPPGAQAALAQRFDGYDGPVSVLLHSEADGPLRLHASWGAGVDGPAVCALLRRAAELLELLADG